jgi:hypothetical protein
LRTFVFGFMFGWGAVIKVRAESGLFMPVLDELQKLGYVLLYQED